MTEPSTIDIVEPRQRSYIQWTPELLRAAEIQADAGRLTLAADLCETMLADDRVKAVTDTRTDTLLGLPLSFEGRSKRAVKALDAQEDWWTQFPETELKLLHAWGILLGVGVAFVPWTKGRDGKRDTGTLRVKNPRNLRFDDNDRQWKFTTRDGERIVTPGDGNWILYTPYGSVRPWSHGAYRALSRWCLLKMYAIADWGCYSERNGQGVFVATGVKGTKEDRRQVAADLRGLARKATLALSEGVDVKLVEAIAKTWDTFKAQIEAADNGAAVTILGQNLTTQASGGGANVSMHGKVALGRTKADAETLSTTLHDQHLVVWAETNYGTPDAAPWAVWDTTPTGDKKEAAAVRQMNAQADATLVQAGIWTPNEARERDGKPPIEGGDKLREGTLAGGGSSLGTTETTTDEKTDSQKASPKDESVVKPSPEDEEDS